MRKDITSLTMECIDGGELMLELDLKKALAGAMVGATLAAGPMSHPADARQQPKAASQAKSYPSNLWMGLVAEDASGVYDVYLAIASVVRNRLAKGMNTGLVALKRKNLAGFVDKERKYLLNTKKVDVESLSKKAIAEVFGGGKDTVGGATHYEHTGKYPVPAWAKDMDVVRRMFPGTRNEITFYKEK